MESIKVYGNTYELKCSCGAYAVVNDGGTDTEPTNCPYCGASEGLSIEPYEA